MARTIDPRRIEAVDDCIVPILRAKTAVERIAMFDAANRTARLLQAAGLRMRHPKWTDAMIESEINRIRINGTI
jgi:hypothetical protein